MGLPSSFSITATALSPEKPGTLSCRILSSSMYSFVRMSMRVDKSCPSLINVGPSSNSPWRRSLAISLRAADFSALSSTFLNLSSRRMILIPKEYNSIVLTSPEPFPLFAHPPSMNTAFLEASDSLDRVFVPKILAPARLRVKVDASRFPIAPFLYADTMSLVRMVSISLNMFVKPMGNFSISSFVGAFVSSVFGSAVAVMMVCKTAGLCFGKGQAG
mmetsp:Transcript_58859/g.120434  ORF Transcript_58859/g.120434 Transcript_58859/m.120434 type:complete len:217 (+) Transcript_58859:1509-2159(+)